MVYTEAVLLETLRISSVAAVGIPHMALDDAKLGNYLIPKVILQMLLIINFVNRPPQGVLCYSYRQN